MEDKGGKISWRLERPGIEAKPFAIADVLGFAEAIRTHTLEQVYANYILFVVMAWASRAPGLSGRPELLVVSDTVLAFPGTGTGGEQALRGMVEYLAVLLYNAIITPGMVPGTAPHVLALPVRAGLSYGSLIADSAHQIRFTGSSKLVPSFPLVLGKPVVDAYCWEQEQKWVGASVDPRCRKQIDEAHPGLLDRLCEEGFLIQWDVPTKHGPVPALAVNYVWRKEEGERLWGRLGRLEEKARASADLSVAAKYLAARRFVEYTLEHDVYNPTDPARGSGAPAEAQDGA